MNFRLPCIMSAVVVLIMLSCPLAYVSDLSDAYDMKEGESAAYFKSGELTEAQTSRLFTDGTKTGLATKVAEGMELNTLDTNVSGVKMSVKEIQYGVASKVSDGSYVYCRADRIEMNISFTLTATCDTVIYGTVFSGMEGACRYLWNNVCSAGDTVEVSAAATYVFSTKDVKEYSKADSGNLVMTGYSSDSHRYVMNEGYVESCAADVKATHGSEVKTFRQEFSCTNTFSMERKCDFGDTSVRSVVPSTVGYFKEGNMRSGTYSGTLAFDGKSSDFSEVYVYDMPETIEIDTADNYGIIIESDIAPVNIVFYSADPSSGLFSDAADATLRDNDAMKAFLEEIGTVSTSYGDVQDLYRDIDGGAYEGLTPLKIAVIVGSFALLGVGIALVVVFVKKHL